MNDSIEDIDAVIEKFLKISIGIKMSEHTKGCIDRYVNHGYPPGSFVYCVLTNNLVGAFRCADAHNSASMRDIVSYVYNCVPATCWGNAEMVANWMLNFKNGEWIGLDAQNPLPKTDDCEHQ